MDTSTHTPDGDLTFDYESVQRLLDSASFALMHAVELYESENDPLDDDCSNSAIAISIVKTVSDRLDARLFHSQ